MPRLGFVSQTHTGDVSWQEAVEQAGDFGFDFVELYLDGATERTRLPTDDVAAALDRRGLDRLVHLPFVDLDLGTPRERVRDACVAELEATLQSAADLGAEKAVLHPSSRCSPPEWEPAAIRPRIVDAVRELDAYAAERGVEVCAENLPGGHFTVSAFDALFDDTDASMTFDTGHARVDGMDEADMAEFLAARRDRVSHVHVNDARVDADEHVPVGSGTTDFATALAPLRDGWNGTLSVEAYTFDADYLELSKAKLEAALDRP